jgi:cytochrome c oxidase subunit IV
MENTQTIDSGHQEPHFDTKPIWRTFWVLLGITLFELALATIHIKTDGRFPPKLVLNGMYLILTCAKAFYIIAEFMHLRHEIKNLIMTVAIPATLFIWFIISFLWDGNSYRELRNRYDRHHYEMQKQKAPPHEKPEGNEPAAQKPGARE